jgi:hypothetical protein
MKPAFVVLLITGALTLAPAAAQADFPEQPGEHLATGCANIINQGTQKAFGTQPGAPDGKVPAATEARIEQQYFDGCVEEGLPQT